MFQTAFNATDGVLLADDFGRTVDGGSWGTVDTTCDAVEQAVEAGLLHLFPAGISDGPGQNPLAVEASSHTELTSQRADQLRQADKSDLVAFAIAEGLLSEDEEVPHKADLVKALALRLDLSVESISVPEPAPETPAPAPVDNLPAADPTPAAEAVTPDVTLYSEPTLEADESTSDEAAPKRSARKAKES